MAAQPINTVTRTLLLSVADSVRIPAVLGTPMLLAGSLVPCVSESVTDITQKLHTGDFRGLRAPVSIVLALVCVTVLLAAAVAATAVATGQENTLEGKEASSDTTFVNVLALCAVMSGLLLTVVKKQLVASPAVQMASAILCDLVVLTPFIELGTATGRHFVAPSEKDRAAITSAAGTALFGTSLLFVTHFVSSLFL